MKGLLLKALSLRTPTEAVLVEHYAHLKSQPYFPNIISFMSSGPVVAMIWEGNNAVKIGRMLLGPTNPSDSPPGTIRGDFAIDVSANICHGSDSIENAKREISLWFPSL